MEKPKTQLVKPASLSTKKESSKSSENGKVKHLHEMTDEQKEKWNKFANSYRKDNWGWVPEDGYLNTPEGWIQVKRMPSGALYIMKGRTWERLTPEWFEKAQRRIDAERMREQADRDNGVTEDDENSNVPVPSS